MSSKVWITRRVWWGFASTGLLATLVPAQVPRSREPRRTEQWVPKAERHRGTAGGPPELTELVKLVAADVDPLDGFGFDVDLDGQWLVVGSPGHQHNPIPAPRTGAVYVYGGSVRAWDEDAELHPADLLDDAGFGTAVAVSGNVIAASAPFDEPFGNRSGSVYVFRYNGTAWVQEQKLTASDGSANDEFGSALALEGNVLAVGCHLANIPGAGGTDAGALYVFRYNGSSWAEEAKLVAPDAVRDNNDELGFSVALFSSVIVAGAPFDDCDEGQPLGCGSAYVFRYGGGAWSFEQRIGPSDGDQDYFFGQSVAVEGSVLAVGAPGRPCTGSSCGGAYVFRYSGSAWAEEQVLTPPDGASLGGSLALVGDVLLAGAPGRSGGGGVYLFGDSGAVATPWNHLGTYVPSGSPSGQELGASVAADGSGFAAGGPGSTNGGAAFVLTSDCQPNDVPDYVDTANGTSTDADNDGVPDECTGCVVAGPCSADLNNWRMRNNNCYNYAIDKKTAGFKHPGGLPWEGTGLPQTAAGWCEKVRIRAERDGLRKVDWQVGQPIPTPPSGTNLVALGAKAGLKFAGPPATRGDYHWWRLNGDGTWSHKRGRAPAKTTYTDKNGTPNPADDVERTLTDPRVAGQRDGYVLCYFMSVPKPPLTVAGEPDEDPKEPGPDVVLVTELSTSGVTDPGEYVTGTDISDLQSHLPSCANPVPDPQWTGVWAGESAGFGVTPGSAVSGFPAFARAFRAVVAVYSDTDGTSITYCPDDNGLEQYLNGRLPFPQGACEVGVGCAITTEPQCRGAGGLYAGHGSICCSTDAECDDGLYCTGPEVCDAGSCLPGAAPCQAPNPVCHESTDTCGPPTARIEITPVHPPGGLPPYPPGTIINENELRADQGGFPAWLNLQISAWAPSEASAYQIVIDPAGYQDAADVPGDQDDIVPAGWSSLNAADGIPCADDTICQTSFGEPFAKCGGNAGFCDPGYLDGGTGTGRADAWCRAPEGCAAGGVAIGSPAFNFFAVSNEPAGTVDGGIVYHAGTLVLDIPAGAKGIYIINLNPDATFVARPTPEGPIDIPSALETGFIINIQTGSCCFSLGTPSAGCADYQTQSECDALPQPSVWSEGTCTQGCPACTQNSDCNDDDSCTIDTCPSDGVCSRGFRAGFAPVCVHSSNPDEPCAGCSNAPMQDCMGDTECPGGRCEPQDTQCPQGSCESVPCPPCGDGTLVLNEECDDGNNDCCDGCSEECLIEPPPCEEVFVEAICVGGQDSGEPCTEDNQCLGGDCRDPDQQRRLYLHNSPPPQTAGPGTTTAIRVRMIDLQNPIPPNNNPAGPCCPPGNFTTFDTAVNSGCLGGNNQGYRCTSDAECSGSTCPTAVGCTEAAASNAQGSCARWVGPPLVYLESNDSPGVGNFKLAKLQCTPFYHDWTAEGPIYVGGAEIVPSSTYAVQNVSSSCMGQEATCTGVSTELLMYTGRAGDVATPFQSLGPPLTQPNALDVTALVAKFRNLAGAVSKAVAQVQPNFPDPNSDINAIDIVTVVDNVRGYGYTYSGPCICPSSVPCNTTACAGASACTGLYGAGATCIKTCSSGPRTGQPCNNNLNCGSCIGGPATGNGAAGIPCDANADCASGSCGLGVCPTGATPGFCRDRCGRCN